MQRPPLPHMVASGPSELKYRMRKSAPHSSSKSMSPSAPIPNRRSHRAATKAGRGSNTLSRLSIITKSLPAPSYFPNSICMCANLRLFPSLPQLPAKNPFMGSSPPPEMRSLRRKKNGKCTEFALCRAGTATQNRNGYGRILRKNYYLCTDCTIKTRR